MTKLVLLPSNWRNAADIILILFCIFFLFFPSKWYVYPSTAHTYTVNRRLGQKRKVGASVWVTILAMDEWETITRCTFRRRRKRPKRHAHASNNSQIYDCLLLCFCGADDHIILASKKYRIEKENPCVNSNWFSDVVALSMTGRDCHIQQKENKKSLQTLRLKHW